MSLSQSDLTLNKRETIARLVGGTEAGSSK